MMVVLNHSHATTVVVLYQDMYDFLLPRQSNDATSHCKFQTKNNITDKTLGQQILIERKNASGDHCELFTVFLVITRKNYWQEMPWKFRNFSAGYSPKK